MLTSITDFKIKASNVLLHDFEVIHSLKFSGSDYSKVSCVGLPFDFGL